MYCEVVCARALDSHVLLDRYAIVYSYCPMTHIMFLSHETQEQLILAIDYHNKCFTRKKLFHSYGLNIQNLYIRKFRRLRKINRQLSQCIDSADSS